MNVRPTGQWWAGGIWGAGSVVAMGVFDQLMPGTIDFTAPVAAGVPLGAAITLLAMQVGAWIRGGASRGPHPTPQEETDP